MQSIPPTAIDSMPAPDTAFTQTRQPRSAEEMVYQSLTVAAILLLLASLWVF